MPQRDQQVYFRVTDEIHQRLVNQATRRGVSVPDLVRFMVADRLDFLEKETGERAREEIARRERVGGTPG